MVIRCKFLPSASTWQPEAASCLRPCACRSASFPASLSRLRIQGEDSTLWCVFAQHLRSCMSENLRYQSDAYSPLHYCAAAPQPQVCFMHRTHCSVYVPTVYISLTPSSTVTLGPKRCRILNMASAHNLTCVFRPEAPTEYEEACANRHREKASQVGEGGEESSSKKRGKN